MRGATFGPITPGLHTVLPSGMIPLAAPGRPGVWPAVALAALAGWAGNASPLAAQADTPWSDRLVSLEADLPGWMDEAGVPGLAMVAVTAGDIWHREFGVREAGTGDSIGPETVFEAASLSKPVFAYLVRGLVEAGDLDLDAPLSDYWTYPDLAGQEWTDRITARMVLSHRSGLPNWRRDGPLEIQFEPGSRYQYSGEGYVYLQRVVAALRGTELPDWADEALFGPLGMRRSSFVFDPGDADVALPHDTAGLPQGKRPAPPPGNAAASLHTTALDFGRFLQRVIRDFRDSPNAIRDLVDAPTEVGPGLGWGLGWGLEYRSGGTPGLWQWGDNGPFKAFVYLDPHAGVAVAFFANSSNGLALTSRVLRRLLPGEHPVLDWLSYDQLR